MHTPLQYISILVKHPCISAHSLQVVAELSLSFGYNISFVDPEGADQPEEKMEMKNTVMRVPDTIGWARPYQVSLVQL